MIEYILDLLWKLNPFKTRKYRTREMQKISMRNIYGKHVYVNGYRFESINEAALYVYYREGCKRKFETIRKYISKVMNGRTSNNIIYGKYLIAK